MNPNRNPKMIPDANAYNPFLYSLLGTREACPSLQVLNSSYASIGPVPLSALGLVAYLAVAVLSVSPQNKDLLYWLCLTMALSSLGLTGILIFVLQAPCPYCAASAFVSAMLLTLVETRRARDAAREARQVTVVQTNEGVASMLPGFEPSATAMTQAVAEEAEPRRAVLGLSAVLALGALRGGTLPSRRLQNAWAYFTQLGPVSLHFALTLSLSLSPSLPLSFSRS